MFMFLLKIGKNVQCGYRPCIVGEACNVDKNRCSVQGLIIFIDVLTKMPSIYKDAFVIFLYFYHLTKILMLVYIIISTEWCQRI